MNKGDIKRWRIREERQWHWAPSGWQQPPQTGEGQTKTNPCENKRLVRHKADVDDKMRKSRKGDAKDKVKCEKERCTDDNDTIGDK